MPDRAPHDEEHPRGTLFLMLLYAVVFAIGWFAVYLIYLHRGGVTP
ncbi:MAG: cytochrome c oxidase subunit 2A [Gemmatimonadales bacterium]